MHESKTDFGRPVWLGFEDADIQWFLHDHQHVKGRAITRLRKEYSETMHDIVERAERRQTCLAFFSFTKPQAKALLKDIGKW